MGACLATVARNGMVRFMAKRGEPQHGMGWAQ